MEPVFETKKGTILYWTGETFYTEDEDDVREALKENLQSDDFTKVIFAEGLWQLLYEHGCVWEI